MRKFFKWALQRRKKSGGPVLTYSQGDGRSKKRMTKKTNPIKRIVRKNKSWASEINVYYARKCGDRRKGFFFLPERALRSVCSAGRRVVVVSTLDRAAAAPTTAVPATTTATRATTSLSPFCASGYHGAAPRARAYGQKWTTTAERYEIMISID